MPHRPTSTGSPGQGEGPEFGRRTADKRPGAKAEPQVDRASPLETLRTAAAGLVRQWELAPPDSQIQYFIQIRALQDQISGLIHRNAALAVKTSPLSWVDLWSPP